jgi:hypothetical protein
MVVRYGLSQMGTVMRAITGFFGLLIFATFVAAGIAQHNMTMIAFVMFMSASLVAVPLIRRATIRVDEGQIFVTFPRSLVRLWGTAETDTLQLSEPRSIEI